jgi:hypothetical protein
LTTSRLLVFIVNYHSLVSQFSRFFIGLGIQPIIELVERRRKEWDKYVTKMDAEMLVEMSKDYYLPEDDFQDIQKKVEGHNPWLK